MILNVNKWNVLKIPKVHADSLKVAWLHKTNLQTMYFPFSWTMKQKKMAKSWKVEQRHTQTMPCIWLVLYPCFESSYQNSTQEYF